MIYEPNTFFVKNDYILMIEISAVPIFKRS